MYRAAALPGLTVVDEHATELARDSRRRPRRRGAGAMLGASCAASRASRTSLSFSLLPPAPLNGSPLRLGCGCRLLRALLSAPTHSLPMRHLRNREPLGTAVAAKSQPSGSRFDCIRPFFRPVSSFHRPACPRRSLARSPHSARPRPRSSRRSRSSCRSLIRRH